MKFLFFLNSVCFFAVVWAIGKTILGRRRQREALDWAATSSKILVSEAKRNWNNKLPKHKVEYAFPIGDQLISGNQKARYGQIFSWAVGPWSDIDADLGKYPVGSEVEIYFDQKNLIIIVLNGLQRDASISRRHRSNFDFVILSAYGRPSSA